jgi:hypothetical protein
VPDGLAGVNVLESVVREEEVEYERELTGPIWERLEEKRLRCARCE